MRALVQRVSSAQVQADGKVTGRIGRGVLVYLGIGSADRSASAEKLAEKVAHLRIFQDEQGKLNLSVRDVRGGVLAVPNFTLLADARKGRRPAFSGAAAAQLAQPLYEAFTAALQREGLQVAKGVFGAEMMIRSEAAGPVNIIVDIPPGGEDAPLAGDKENRTIRQA